MAKRDEGALKAAIWTRELEKIELIKKYDQEMRVLIAMCVGRQPKKGKGLASP